MYVHTSCTVIGMCNTDHFQSFHHVDHLGGILKTDRIQVPSRAKAKKLLRMSEEIHKSPALLKTNVCGIQKRGRLGHTID